ncbi:vWA domain-containing protein [Georgenia sp. Z1491]|uniref:vWA domain-containing protein n=1 Tax=Georgenia sp. Z1491 TaxID=3416707 RepID=UPI003CEE7721
MVTPWLWPVAIVVVLAAAALGWFFAVRGTRRPEDVTWVANSSFIRSLPRYQQRMRTMRILLGGAAAVLALTSVAGGALAARPVDRDVRHEELTNRDIVLCLDVSGSMIEFDAEIMAEFQELVESFDGERIALNIWNSTTRVVFPLTDDYALVNEELEHGAEVLGSYLDWSSTDWEEIDSYMRGTTSTSSMSSSLIGDGLANCVNGFDLDDDERSRSIILATDNEIAGDPVYELEEAAELAQERGVTVHGLYASTLGSAGGPMRDEYESVVTEHGGVFYELGDPGAVPAIVEQVQDQQEAELDADPTVVVTDRPDRWLGWLVAGLTGFLVVVWRVRS